MLEFSKKLFSASIVSLFLTIQFSPLASTLAQSLPDSFAKEDPAPVVEELGTREGTILDDGITTPEVEVPEGGPEADPAPEENSQPEQQEDQTEPQEESTDETQPAEETTQEEVIEEGKVVVNGAITYKNIKISEEYSSIEAGGAKVVFTSLPANYPPISLTIKKLTVGSEVNAEEILSPAYQITTNPDLPEGSFSAQITLGLSEQRSISQGIEVKYSEDGVNYNTQTQETTEANQTSITFTTDHFTIFVITDDDAVLAGGPWVEQQDRGSSEDATFDIHYVSSITASDTATWNFSSVASGTYYVYVSWTTHPANRSTAVNYALTYNGGTVNRTVNQRQLADQSTTGTPGQFSGWYSFGAHSINASSKLVMSSTDFSTTDMVADEVLLVPSQPATVNSKLTKDTTPSLSGTISVDDDNNPTSVKVEVGGQTNYVNTDGSGNWTLADNTLTALAEGVYDVAVSYTNMGGDTITDATVSELEIDTTAPDVNITSPANGDVVSGVVDIKATIVESNPSHYWLRIQGPGYTGGPGTVTQVSSINSPTTLLSWDTTGLTDGTYTIKLEARDKVTDPDGNGNKDAGSVHWINVTVDNTAPAKPTWGTIYTGHVKDASKEIGCGGITNTTAVSFEWNLNSESDIAGYWFGTKFNDHHQYFAHPNNFKTANMTPGNNPYYYTIIAVDNAGNESPKSDLCTLTLDQVKPTVTITNLTDNMIYPLSPSIDVIGSANDNLDVDFVRVQISPAGANTWTLISKENNPGGVPFDWSTNTGNLPDGKYDIRARAVDTAGNVSNWYTVKNITLDNTKPYGSIIFPAANSYQSGSFLVGGKAYDDLSGVKQVRVRFRDADTNALVGTFFANYNSATDNWGININNGVNNVPDGKYKIVVRIMDNAGNVRFYTRYVTVDNEAPDAEITNPSHLDLVSGTVDIRGSVEDENLAGWALLIRKVGGPTIYFDIQAEDTSFVDTSLYLWDTTAVADGDYYIVLFSADKAGNIDLGSVDLIRVTVDNTAPVTTLTSPTADSFWNTPIVIEGESTDLNTVSEVKLYYRAAGTLGPWTLIDTLPNSADDEPFAFSYNWTPPSDGKYDIKAEGTDKAGNVKSGPIVLNVTYDVTPPVITVTPKTTADTTPSVSGTVDDATATIKVTINGVTYTATNNGDGTWTLPDNTISPALAEGTYNVTAKATDPTGNVGTDPTSGELVISIPAPVVTTPVNNNNNNGGGGNPPSGVGEGDVLGESDEFVLRINPGDVDLGVGEEFTFNLSSDGRDLSEISCVWDFGDGSQVETDGTGSAAQNHAYSEAGEYLITVTCTDPDGNTTTTTSTASVSDEDTGSVQGTEDESDDSGDTKGESDNSIIDTIKDNILLCCVLPLVLLALLLIIFWLRRRRDREEK